MNPDFNLPVDVSPSLNNLQIFLSKDTGTHSQCHNDATDSILVNIGQGYKSIWLAPPNTEIVDGLSYYLNNDGKEEKKFLSYNPSLDLFRSSRWKHLVLLPGEMLFLPKHWWHDVTSTAGSVALSINLTEKRTTSPTKILTLKTKRKEKDDDDDVYEISKTSNCKSSSKKSSKKSSSSSSTSTSSSKKGRPFTTESANMINQQRREKQQRRKEVLKQQMLRVRGGLQRSGKKRGGQSQKNLLLSSSISTDGIRSSTRKTKKQRGFTCSICNHEGGSLLYLAGNYVDEQELVSGQNDKLELFCFNCRTPGAKQISESDFGRTIEFDKILVK